MPLEKQGERGETIYIIIMRSVILNLADIVKKRTNINKSDHVANEMSTFLKQINKKLSLIDLKLEDFKRDSEYNFSEATAELLIELHDLKLGQSISKFEKNNIESADRNIMTAYLKLVANLCASHFEYDVMEQIEKKLLAIHTELNIYEKTSLKKVAEELFKEDSKTVDIAVVHTIEKLFVDIYSSNKYPYLTEMDRVSLFTELESQLALVLEEHKAAIEKVNSYRSSDDIQDEDINEILEY